MSEQPTVSVICIFFNEERFLAEAVESVRAQGYGDWELLICDDGSSDGSTAIAKRLADEDSRIRYIEHEGHANHGMSATRNLGIQNARGRYLSFIDADDVWLPTKLASQVALLEGHPEAGFLCAPARWWFGWTGKRADALEDFIQPIDVPTDTVVDPPAIITSYLRNQFTSLCDVLIRREVMESVGGYESQFRGLYEDQAFHTKLCLKHKAYQCSSSWYKYRQHPDSCCHTSEVDAKHLVIREKFLTWMEGYLDEQGAGDRELRKTLRWELLPFRRPGLQKVRERWWGLREGVKQSFYAVGRRVMPGRLRLFAWRLVIQRTWTPLRWVVFYLGRSATPFSRELGYDRGKPIDRHYIEAYLDRHRGDIKGRVLEIADDTYTRMFGGDRVEQADILHSPEGTPGPEVTIIDDLTTGQNLEDNAYDCLVITQTLLFIYELDDALRTLHRCLKPGGVLLLTLPGITQIIRDDADQWGQYWSFTALSARRLLEEHFPKGRVGVQTYGNAVSACGFLMGLASEEVSPKALDAHDRDYPLIIGARAQKAGPA